MNRDTLLKPVEVNMLAVIRRFTLAFKDLSSQGLLISNLTKTICVTNHQRARCTALKTLFYLAHAIDATWKNSSQNYRV